MDDYDASALPDLAAGRLSTAVVSDILDDLGHRDHVLDPAIRPLGDAGVIAGWANPFVVAEVDEIPADPYTGEIAAMDDIAPGDVVLIAAGGSARAACWGDAETVRRALEKVSKENGVRDALAGGSTLRSAYDQFGVL
jgi:regulator of RNase E activity RraA